MSDGNRSDVQQRLAELNDNVRKASLRGAWQREGRTREPGVNPWVWPWKDILPSITEAGEIVPIDDVMRMRTIGLVNPSQVLPFGTTRTFGVTIQHLNPGIQGGGVYTTAEGEQQFMEPGDLLVQPNWTWHGSQNDGKTPALWLTAMDISLADYLGAWFREKYPGERVQPFTKADGYHLRRMGGLRSNAALEGEGPFPVKYPWRETLETLTLAFIARYLAFGTRLMHSAMLQLHQELEEASHASGAGSLQTFCRITLRLLTPAFLSGWLWVLVHAAKDFSVALLLASAGSALVANLIYESFIGGHFNESAAMLVVLITFNLILVIAGRKFIGKSIAA